MNRDDYIGGSISVRMYEQNLLTQNDLERLNDYNSIDEVLAALNDSIYRDSIQALNRPEDYEQILENELNRVYNLIDNTSDNPWITRFLRERYNFHNLKVVVKEIVQNENYSHIYSNLATIDMAHIKRELLNEEGKEVDFLSKLNIEGYEPLVSNAHTDDDYVYYAKEAIKVYERTGNPKDIDLYLDQVYYDNLIYDAEHLELDEAVQFTKERIDLINIKTLLRVRAQGGTIEDLTPALIEGGYIDVARFVEVYNNDLNNIVVTFSNERINKYLVNAIDSDKSIDQNLLDLEKAIDDHMMDYSREAKSSTFGPEVLINYVISKETEIKNLRIILVSKLNGLSKEFTSERLRETYA